MSSVCLVANGQSMTGNTDETLLNQLEQQGLHVEYQCRSGLCGACRCRLISGEVQQKDAMAFVAADEILACCSTPQSDLVIEFDYQLGEK